MDQLFEKPKFQLFLNWICIFVVIIYLGWVNHNIGFLTMDEFNYVTSDFDTNFSIIVKSGRTSQLIGLMLIPLTDFLVPDFFALIPRLCTMLLLYFALVLTVSLIKQIRKWAIPIASIVLVTHQLDWEHNGLIAYFGNYNLYLSLFLISLKLEFFSRERLPHRIIAGLLVFFSFSSELFLGLALAFMFINVCYDRSVLRTLRSSWAFAIAVYCLLFILQRNFINESKTSETTYYLTGSVQSYNLTDILRGFSLYVFHSMPQSFYSFMSKSTFVFWGCLAICLSFFFAFRIIVRLIWSKDSLKVEKDGSILFVFCVLLVSPQLLMSVSPLKLGWILQSASTRYVFSFYTWISIVILFVYSLSKFFPFLYRNEFLSSGSKVSLFLIVLFGIYLSGQRNVDFVRTLRESKRNIVAVSKIAARDDTVIVRIPSKYMSHPYILAIQDEHMINYVKTISGKNAIICKTQVVCGNDFD